MSTRNLSLVEAAALAGMTPRTFRVKAKTDASCPPIIQMSPRIALVNEAALMHWIESKTQKRRPGADCSGTRSA